MSKKEEAMPETYLSDQDLATRYGVHRTTIWRWAQDPDFPAPIRLSPGCTRWQQSAVDAWEVQQGED